MRVCVKPGSGFDFPMFNSHVPVSMSAPNIMLVNAKLNASKAGTVRRHALFLMDALSLTRPMQEYQTDCFAGWRAKFDGGNQSKSNRPTAQRTVQRF
jgi:hypothetical protein